MHPKCPVRFLCYPVKNSFVGKFFAPLPPCLIFSWSAQHFLSLRLPVPGYHGISCKTLSPPSGDTFLPQGLLTQKTRLPHWMLRSRSTFQLCGRLCPQIQPVRCSGLLRIQVSLRYSMPLW